MTTNAAPDLKWEVFVTPGIPIVTRDLPPGIKEAYFQEMASTLIYGDKDWSRPSDRQANKQLLPRAEFTQVPSASHFIALERPDVPANLLNSMA